MLGCIAKKKESAGAGAFSGKIWVVDHDIVRFSGTFLDPPPRSKGTYVSFDSVRYKAPNGRWLPWRTYLDQTGLPPSAPAIALCAHVLLCGASIHEGSIYQGLQRSSQTKTWTQRRQQ